jgi:hypothetical protein
MIARDAVHAFGHVRLYQPSDVTANLSFPFN